MILIKSDLFLSEQLNHKTNKNWQSATARRRFLSTFLTTWHTDLNCQISSLGILALSSASPGPGDGWSTSFSWWPLPIPHVLHADDRLKDVHISEVPVLALRDAIVPCTWTPLRLVRRIHSLFQPNLGPSMLSKKKLPWTVFVRHTRHVFYLPIVSPISQERSRGFWAYFLCQQRTCQWCQQQWIQHANMQQKCVKELWKCTHHASVAKQEQLKMHKWLCCTVAMSQEVAHFQRHFLMCSQVVGMLFWLLFTLLACFLVALKVWHISSANSVEKLAKQREDKKKSLVSTRSCWVQQKLHWGGQHNKLLLHLLAWSRFSDTWVHMRTAGSIRRSTSWWRT